MVPNSLRWKSILNVFFPPIFPLGGSCTCPHGNYVKFHVHICLQRPLTITLGLLSDLKSDDLALIEFDRCATESGQ